MLHTFLANEPFRTQIEAALAELRRALDLGHLGVVDTKSLRVADASEHHGGSKPILALESEAGKSYIFKRCDPALAAAEVAAYELRQLGQRPVVPARALELQIEGQAPRFGLLKPFVEFPTDAELDPDTTTWTPEQRSVMLLEHAWEWFLDNLDTNTSQYALLGPLRLPLDIDWDRAFFSAGRSEFTRVAKYRSTLPNARTFLYADYVAGRIKLPLWMLADEARRIRRLPKAAAMDILTRYARVAFDNPAARQEFVTRMLFRRRGIEREVGTFMRALWAERRTLQAPARNPAEWINRQRWLVWSDWQIVLNSVMRGPVGNAARRALSTVRGLDTP